MGIAFFVSFSLGLSLCLCSLAYALLDERQVSGSLIPRFFFIPWLHIFLLNFALALAMRFPLSFARERARAHTHTHTTFSNPMQSTASVVWVGGWVGGWVWVCMCMCMRMCMRICMCVCGACACACVSVSFSESLTLPSHPLSVYHSDVSVSL